MLEGYDLDLDKVVEWIKKKGSRTVGLQLPEGLRTKHKALIDVIEDRTGTVMVYVGEPCYGACDLADTWLEGLGVDALVHIGHTPLGGKFRIPVLFEPLSSKVPIDDVVRKAVDLLTSPVGLLTTAQHLTALGRAREVLEAQGIGTLSASGTRAKGDGQVLGCSYSALRNVEERVESFLFIGSGRFHPLGAALSTEKKVVHADPYLGTVEDMSEQRDRTLRQRHGLITKASTAGSFLIIVSTKSGQQRLPLAKRLRKLLLENLRAVTIVTMGSITPENLMGLEGEIIVSTACPRVALDESQRFDRPILTPPELEIALDLRKWEDYVLDEF